MVLSTQEQETLDLLLKKKYEGNNQKYSAKPNQVWNRKTLPRPQKMTEAGAEAVMKALARIKLS